MTSNYFSGKFWWVSNEKSLPFLIYVLSEDLVKRCVYALPAHDEVDLASADDLVFQASDVLFSGSRHRDELDARDLVVMCRLPFELPDHYLGKNPFAKLTEGEQADVRETVHGERRAVHRTGVLIRSREDMRWDVVQEFTSLINEVLDFDQAMSEAVREQRILNRDAERPQEFKAKLKWQINTAAFNDLRQLGLGGDYVKVVESEMTHQSALSSPDLRELSTLSEAFLSVSALTSLVGVSNAE